MHAQRHTRTHNNRGHSAFMDNENTVHVSGTHNGFRKIAYVGKMGEKFPNLTRFGSKFFFRDGADEPRAVMKDCADVVCGAALTCVVDKKGGIWCGGDNTYGQCGSGFSSEEDVWPLQRIRNTKNVTVSRAALGLHHGLFVSTNGELHVWGHNRSGQLGTGNTHPYTSARHLRGETLGHVRDVAAGLTHSAAMNDCGDVFVWGKQLHVEDVDEHLRRPKDQITPRLVEGLPEPAVSVKCGVHNTAILTESGRVFMIGRVSSSSNLSEIKLTDGGIYSDSNKSSEKMNALAKKLPDLSPLPGVKPLSETHRVDGRELRVVGMTRMVLEPWEVTFPKGTVVKELRDGFDGVVAITDDGKSLQCEVGKSPEAVAGSESLPENFIIDDVAQGWKHTIFTGYFKEQQ